MPTVTEAAVSASAYSNRLPGDGADSVVVAWRIHPLRTDPRGIVPVLAAYGVAILIWRLVFPQPLALFLPLVALTGALSDYLFPTTIRLTERGAYSNCGVTRLFIAWPDVRRATRGADGIFLSPFSRPSRLDNFRGVRLRFGADIDPESVVRAVKSLRAAASSAPHTRKAGSPQ